MTAVADTLLPEKPTGKTNRYHCVSWEEGELLDYATLAKSGGRKDLLHHVGYISGEDTDEPVAYPPSVKWFSHPSPSQHNTPTSPYQSPLKSHWCQWNTSDPHLPNINNFKADFKTSKKGKTDSLKFPKLGASPKDEVDFSRLLSLDYQREWLDRRENRLHNQQRRAKERRAAQHKKLQDHTMKVRRAHIQQPGTESKFKMKRFVDVPGRLNLPPI